MARFWGGYSVSSCDGVLIALEAQSWGAKLLYNYNMLVETLSRTKYRYYVESC